MANDTARQVVVFGTGKLSEMAWSVLAQSGQPAAAFAVDRAFLVQDRHLGLPVMAFEDLSRHYPPHAADILVPIGYRDVNRARQKVVEQVRAAGYGLAGFVDPMAHVSVDARLGDGVIVFDHASVQAFASVGENAILRSATAVSHHAEVGAYCFLAIGAAIGGGARLGPRCFIGMNATVLPETTVGAGCVIGAGAVLTCDAEPNGVYVGAPARRLPGPADQAGLR